MSPVSKPKDIGVAIELVPSSASDLALRRSFESDVIRNLGGRGVRRAAQGTRPVMPRPRMIMKTPAANMIHGLMALRVELSA